MPRVPVLVRSVSLADVSALAPLWAEFRETSGSALSASAVLDIPDRLRERLAASDAVVAVGGRPTYRLAVAEVSGVAVGFASLTVVDRGLMTASSAVLVEVVHVNSSHRKTGIGTQLLREAAGFADEVGATDVVVNVPPALRDLNRFYARHGFAPMVLRRSAPIGALRRKLGVDTRLDATIDLTPVQRSLRRRALLSPRRSAVRP